MTATDRTGADEGDVERVARAMWREAAGGPPSDWAWGQDGENYRRLARAALTELAAPGTDGGGGGQAVQRVHGPGKCVSVEDANRVLAETRDAMQAAVRAAVAGPQRDHGGEGGQ